MCLILFAYRAHPNYPLLVAANRDELFDRPSAQASFWPDAPQLLAGRDLLAGGTWLGITTGGRFAAITNYRDPNLRPAPRSRGELTKDFLLSNDTPRQYARGVVERGSDYAGFNLLVGDGEELYYCNNQTHQSQALEPGIYGLSNHLLNTPWPKVTNGKQRLAQLVSQRLNSEELLALLADPTVAPDIELPDTGVGLSRERLLSPAFITGDSYGTCCSTALIVDQHNHVVFHERTFAKEPATAKKLSTTKMPPGAVDQQSPLREVADEKIFNFSLNRA